LFNLASERGLIAIASHHELPGACAQSFAREGGDQISKALAWLQIAEKHEHTMVWRGREWHDARMRHAVRQNFNPRIRHA
jgi:hypothetical protein